MSNRIRQKILQVVGVYAVGAVACGVLHVGVVGLIGLGGIVGSAVESLLGSAVGGRVGGFLGSLIFAAVVVFGCGALSFVVAVGSFAVGNFVVGNFVGSGVVGGGIIDRRQCRDLQVPAGPRMVPPLTSRSLRWVRSLLPRDEGTAWLNEVTSILAEAPRSTRRRYVRNYRREIPKVVWTSWSEHLRQRDLL